MRRARIECGENARLAIARDFGYRLESGIAQQLHGEFTAFVNATIFRGDRWLMDPLLQTAHVLVMLLRDLGKNWLQIFVIRCPRHLWHRESSGGGCCGLKKGSAVHGSKAWSD